MELLGVPLTTQVNVTKLFWVQGPHGALTVVHGGGNLQLETEGTFHQQTLSGSNQLTRIDGRSSRRTGPLPPTSR